MKIIIKLFLLNIFNNPYWITSDYIVHTKFTKNINNFSNIINYFIKDYSETKLFIDEGLSMMQNNEIRIDSLLKFWNSIYNTITNNNLNDQDLVNKYLEISKFSESFSKKNIQMRINYLKQVQKEIDIVKQKYIEKLKTQNNNDDFKKFDIGTDEIMDKITQKLYKQFSNKNNNPINNQKKSKKINHIKLNNNVLIDFFNNNYSIKLIGGIGIIIGIGIGIKIYLNKNKKNTKKKSNDKVKF
jgi:hypothetical protein